MQYDPKLKKAKAEIEAVLVKYDIAGAVVLHSPGFGEHFMKINPSYSCAFFDNSPGVTGIRVRARIQEDFQGVASKRHKAMEDTANMFDIFCDLVGKQALNCMDTMDMLRKHLDITTTRGRHTGNEEQNN